MVVHYYSYLIRIAHIIIVASGIHVVIASVGRFSLSLYVSEIIGKRKRECSAARDEFGILPEIITVSGTCPTARVQKVAHGERQVKSTVEEALAKLRKIFWIISELCKFFDK